MARTARKSTAKKSTAKKPRKAVAKKPAAKAASANAPAKSLSWLKPKSSDRVITVEKLRNFNIFAAVANVIFAVLSVIFLSKDSVEFTWAYASRNLFADDGSVLGAAYKIFADIEVRYILAFIFGLSAVFWILLATVLRKHYEAQLKNNVSVLRWIFTGVGLGLTLEFITSLTSVGDIATLKLVGVLIVVTTLLAIHSESMNKGSKGKFGAFYISLITGALAWVPLVISLVATGVYGLERFGWHVYTLSGLVLVCFIAIALNQYRSIRFGLSNKTFLELESKYISIDFLVKLITFAVILIAFYK